MLRSHKSVRPCYLIKCVFVTAQCEILYFISNRHPDSRICLYREYLLFVLGSLIRGAEVQTNKEGAAYNRDSPVASTSQHHFVIAFRRGIPSMGLRRRGLRYKTAAGSGHCCLDSNEVKCYMCWPQKAGGARLRRGVRTQYYGNTCGGILCQTLSLSAMCIYVSR